MEHLVLEIWRYAQVAIGIGLVIFVHESGHFLAARLCKVRVDVFSLGFGPRLFGWRRGATNYQLALLPLGGYVKMAGEDVESGAPALPDELHSKSVGQRFFIYSGGVLANVAFGLVVFPLIMALGVPFAEPLLGPSTPGSAAWHAGIEPGTRVLAVNGNEVYGFLHIPSEVALGSADETLLEVVGPGAKARRSLRLRPAYSEEMGVYSIGVNPAVDPEGRITVSEDSPAARAGLRSGDRLLSVKDAVSGLSLVDQLLMAGRDAQPFTAVFERDETEGKRTLEVQLAAEPSKEVELKLLGVAPVANRVIDVRATPLVARLDLRKDDRILSVNGVAILREFDFLRALRAGAGPVRLRIERDGERREIQGSELSPEDELALYGDVGLTIDTPGTRVVVNPGSAAEKAGLRDGDRILKIDGGEARAYKDIKTAAEAARDGRSLAFTVERRGAAEDAQFLELSFGTAAFRPPTYGLDLQSAQYIYKAAGPVQAVRVGVAASWKFIEESWLTLKGILRGRVSGNNIGGIITIGVVSHSWASVGITKLLFFLCMLSMNLAFLNVLPIPVLDGGHLFFLLIEKIKGSPVSEKVLGYSQMVGIVLILSLMVYVTFNDVMRLIGK